MASSSDLVPEVQEDEITKILNSHGIKYTHHNDDILAPSHIEEAQIETAIKVGSRESHVCFRNANL